MKTETDASSPWLRPGVLVLGIVAGLTVLDQVTKVMALNMIGPGGVKTVIPGFFELVCTYNKGAAGGILQGQRLLLTSISLLAFVGIIWKYQVFVEGWIERGVAASLLLGGIAGNFFDRAFRDGGVVDFLNFYFPFIPSRWFNPWPTFNVADTCICVGVGIYLVSTYVRPEPEKEEAES